MLRNGIKGLGLGFLALGFSTQSSFASPLTPSEETVCKNVRHCLDILKRHNPEEFDYQVLKDEFRGFGQTGKERLLKAISDKDLYFSENAALILSLSPYELTEKDVKFLADQWPVGEVESLANLMLSEYSPPIRQAAISTLTHQNEDIASWSREILKLGEMGVGSGNSERNRFQPSPEAFEALTTAAQANPTREITSFLAQYPTEQSQPILIKLLSSKSPAVVSAALKGLYASDPKNSFNALKSSIRNLSNGEEGIAFAIAGAVRTQYEDTQDEAFISFAEDLVETSSPGEFEAMVGVDILMGLGPQIKLPETDIALTGLENALAAHGTVPLFYMDGLAQKFGANLAPGLNLLWAALDKPASSNKSYFLKALSTFAPNDTLSNILRSGLKDQADWRVVTNAAEIAGTRKLIDLEPILREVAETHPVLTAKAAALAALDILSDKNTGDFSTLARAWEKQLAGDAKYCAVKSHPFKSESSQLPYFNSVPIAYAEQTTRASLSSAVSTGQGWLAGYDQGEFSGGLVYYDNRTGAGELVYGQADPNEAYTEYYVPNIAGVAPKIKRSLGQYGEDYWAFSGLNYFGSDGAILYVSFQKGEIQIKRHFQLPAAPQAIERLEDNSFLIGFGEKPEVDNPFEDSLPPAHPPLRLLPDGSVVTGCPNPAPTNIKATP